MDQLMFIITKYWSLDFHKENRSKSKLSHHTHKRLATVEICVPVLGNTVINTSGHWSVDKPGVISWSLITCKASHHLKIQEQQILNQLS